MSKQGCLLCRTIDGEKMEPLEEVMCELEDEFSGPVIDALSLRKGEVLLSPCLLSRCVASMPIDNQPVCGKI